MPRILIAGCGYVGEATADLFHCNGWDVEGWVHSNESAARLSAKPYPIRAIDVLIRGRVFSLIRVLELEANHRLEVPHVLCAGGGAEAGIPRSEAAGVE